MSEKSKSYSGDFNHSAVVQETEKRVGLKLKFVVEITLKLEQDFGVQANIRFLMPYFSRVAVGLLFFLIFSDFLTNSLKKLYI